MKIPKKEAMLAAVSFAVLAVLVVAANLRTQEQRMATSVDFIMDTVVEQKLYGKNAQQAVQEISRRLQEYEQQCSMYVAESEISALNQNAGKQYTELSPQTLELVQRSKLLAEESDGLFDITIAPLTKLWGITTEHPRVPTQQEIDSAKELVDYQDILIDGNQAMLRREGQSVDLGAVAKGAACNIVRETAETYHIRGGYVSIGGNLIVLGNDQTGQPYYFGVRDPQGDSSAYIGKLTLDQKTMATTGIYERYFEQDGVKYHHILDPRTGYPAESDLISVSVISEDGLLADCLSTTLFLEGKQAALSKLEETAYQLILVDADGNVYYSSALEGNFEPNTQTQYRFFAGKGGQER